MKWSSVKLSKQCTLENACQLFYQKLSSTKQLNSISAPVNQLPNRLNNHVEISLRPLAKLHYWQIKHNQVGKLRAGAPALLLLSLINHRLSSGPQIFRRRTKTNNLVRNRHRDIIRNNEPAGAIVDTNSVEGSVGVDTVKSLCFCLKFVRDSLACTAVKLHGWRGLFNFLEKKSCFSFWVLVTSAHKLIKFKFRSISEFGRSSRGSSLDFLWCAHKACKIALDLRPSKVVPIAPGHDRQCPIFSSKVLQITMPLVRCVGEVVKFSNPRTRRKMWSHKTAPCCELMSFMGFLFHYYICYKWVTGVGVGARTTVSTAIFFFRNNFIFGEVRRKLANSDGQRRLLNWIRRICRRQWFAWR